MPVLDYVTAVAAVGGLLLGLWAACRPFLDDRVRLRVTASLKKVDNSWLVDGGVDEVGFVKNFSSYGEEFVAVSVTNMSKFPVALASVDLVLKDGDERRIPQVLGAIEPKRRKGFNYPLLEQNRFDELGNVASENVSSCRVRTECGVEILKPVRGSLAATSNTRSMARNPKHRLGDGASA